MLNTLKVLLVEDDDLFRSTIKQSLQKKSCEVIEVPNGKIAKETLLLHKFDLVISDIQMPHFTGIDLLEWMKGNVSIPIILMTGFSQVVEARKAHELGVDGFLAKPFKESDLFEVLSKYLSKIKKLDIPVDLDKQFCKVSVDEFLTEKETEYNIYIRISNSKYIKIAHAGGKISEDRVSAYKEKGIHFVYIKKEDFPKIVKFNLKVAKIAQKSSQINPDKKINFLKHTGELILENVFVNGVDVDSFHESKDFVETSMNALTEDDKLFTVLEVLSTHADFLYAHSLGVSTFSVMIARELGWTSAQTLFKLSLGGLFHDIGKKEIERTLLEKARPLLSQNERKLIESHTTRGKEILESLGTIPSEVVQIAYQHHENALAQGFPRSLSRNEMHPLAKVVHVANIFCEYAVKYNTEVTPIAAAQAISNMESLKAQEMDKDAFAALKRLFK